ncbi:hypothetical protein BOX15_Mlig014239g6, partial [Macrostomum lignano]
DLKFRSTLLNKFKTAVTMGSNSDIEVLKETIEPINTRHGVFSCFVKYNNNGSRETIKLAIKSFAKNQIRSASDVAKDLQIFRREYKLLSSFKSPKTNEAHKSPQTNEAHKSPQTNEAHKRIVSAWKFMGYSDELESYTPLFLMELADRNLYNLLLDTSVATVPDGPYSFGHFIRFMQQIADALAYLHGGIQFEGKMHNIIHRDLKGCNILLFDEGRNCKLSDFGISKPVEQPMTRGVGTPYWRAPEVANGEDYTTAADCYSFGMVCIESLFRSHPNKIGRSDDVEDPIESDESVETKLEFFSEGWKVLYLNMCTFEGSDAFNEECRRRTRSLLEKLLTKGPSERISAQKANEELKGILNDMNIQDWEPLYGPNVPRRPVAANNEARPDIPPAVPTVSEDPSIGRSIPRTDPAIFFKITGTEFNDANMRNLRSTIECHLHDLNTLATQTGQPCTASLQFSLDKLNAEEIDLEIRIKQQDTNETSVHQWCYDNFKKCESKFNGLFEDRPNFRPKFTMEIPQKHIEQQPQPVLDVASALAKMQMKH